jgi:hypothetical protein
MPTIPSMRDLKDTDIANDAEGRPETLIGRFHIQVTESS